MLRFSGLLASKAWPYKSLNNQLCMTRPTLIDLNPDEHHQELRNYPCMISLDRYNGSIGNTNE